MTDPIDEPLDERTTHALDRLLADGELSGPEHDRIFQRVLATLEREEGPRNVFTLHPMRWAGVALAAAAAVMLVVYLPRTPAVDHGELEEGALTGSSLRIACVPGSLQACPASSKLVFSLGGKPMSGVLSAYAEPVGHAGERVFYFSKEDGSARLAKGGADARGAERTLRIPAQQTPGRYRVHAVLADRALGRDELIASASADEPGARVRARVDVELAVGE